VEGKIMPQAAMSSQYDENPPSLKASEADAGKNLSNNRI
jgi:hypothetical protein